MIDSFCIGGWRDVPTAWCPRKVISSSCGTIIGAPAKDYTHKTRESDSVRDFKGEAWRNECVRVSDVGTRRTGTSGKGRTYRSHCRFLLPSPPPPCSCRRGAKCHQRVHLRHRRITIGGHNIREHPTPNSRDIGWYCISLYDHVSCALTCKLAPHLRPVGNEFKEGQDGRSCGAICSTSVEAH